MANLALSLDTGLKKAIKNLRKQGAVIEIAKKLKTHRVAIKELLETGISVETIAEDFAKVFDQAGVAGDATTITSAIKILIATDAKMQRSGDQLAKKPSRKSSDLTEKAPISEQTVSPSTEQDPKASDEENFSTSLLPVSNTSESNPPPHIKNRRTPEVQARIDENRAKQSGSNT